jgi:DNA-binding NarL/FixJ family response regulator
VHADVLVACGRWSEAEESLVTALDAHARGYPAMASGAQAALALLRVRQGRLAEAEELLADRAEQPLALLARAELHLAQAEPASAVALLERALAAVPDDVLTEARLLTPLVSASLAADDVERARAACARLDELAVGSASRLVQARASLAAARLANAESRTADARSHAQVALELLGALEMPYEMAEARLELARALADELPSLARDEAQAAHTSFRALGASRGIDAASALLQTLGGAAPAGLTPREAEVLSLVARGLTNAAIADALFISEKTAGHHVSRILSKLGVRNRAEAAAYAARLTG